MHEPPAGTVSLFFSDIEGRGGRRVRGSAAHAPASLREAFRTHGGYEVDAEGDAFFVSFESANEAVSAAEAAQLALARRDWPHSRRVSVRIGIHTGEPRLLEGKYVGLDVHRDARVMAGHGGQALMTEPTRELLNGRFAVRDLGEHRLAGGRSRTTRCDNEPGC